MPPQPYFTFGTPELGQGALARSASALTFSPIVPRRGRQPKKGWRSTNTGYAADTILVLTVKTRDTGERDAAGSPIPEVVSTGRGRGVLADRAARCIRFGGPNTPQSAAWEFTTPAGLVLPVPPGRTWLALMESTGQVAFDWNVLPRDGRQSGVVGGQFGVAVPIGLSVSSLAARSSLSGPS